MPRKRRAKKMLKKRVIDGKTYHLKICYKRKRTAVARAKAARAKTVRKPKGQLARVLLIDRKHCVYVH